MTLYHAESPVARKHLGVPGAVWSPAFPNNTESLLFLISAGLTLPAECAIISIYFHWRRNLELTWMGRYRELVRALVYYSNASNRGTHGKVKSDLAYGLNQNEYQILEYICEFENENRIMTDISRDTGILQSIVTKATKRLVELGLVERYRIVGNRKSVILKPTEQGKQTYVQYAEQVCAVFAPFFQSMEGFSDEQLKRFEQSVRALGGDWGESSDNTTANLEKIR